MRTPRSWPRLPRSTMRLPRWAPRPTSFERDVRVLCPCAVGGCEANPFGRDAMGRTATIAHACPIFMHVPPGMRLALLLRLRSSFPPLLSSRADWVHSGCCPKCGRLHRCSGNSASTRWRCRQCCSSARRRSRTRCGHDVAHHSSLTHHSHRTTPQSLTLTHFSSPNDKVCRDVITGRKHTL